MNVITIAAYSAASLYYLFPGRSLAKWIFAGFLGSMILNAFFPHLIVTIRMKKYAPGLLTGLMFNVPINSVLIYQMLSMNFIQWKEIVFSTVLVGSFLLLMIPFLFKIGSRLLVNNIHN